MISGWNVYDLKGKIDMQRNDDSAEDTLEVMKFNSFVIRSTGVSTTFRRGDKWDGLSIGDEFIIDDGTIGYKGVVTGKLVGVYSFMDWEYALMHHHETTVDVHGMLNKLSSIYTGFTEDEVVTCIFFRVEKQ